MWVVKLGGSLAFSNNLGHWLRSLTGLRLVLVPGGGPFADQVRAVQRHWKFADDAAHHMALIAMEQYGRMLCAIQPGLEPAVNLSEIDAVLKRGRVPVWMASVMAMEDAGLERSWNLTSDSLAAWLAGLLQADALILIKSADITSGPASLDELMGLGLVDKLFVCHARAAGITVWLLSDKQIKGGGGDCVLRQIVAGSGHSLDSALWVDPQ